MISFLLLVLRTRKVLVLKLIKHGPVVFAMVVQLTIDFILGIVWPLDDLCRPIPEKFFPVPRHPGSVCAIINGQKN